MSLPGQDLLETSRAPILRAASAQEVFLPPLPRQVPPHPYRANRARAPIRDAPAAENLVPHLSHPWEFRAGFRMLPVATRCQFALAAGAPVLRRQNSVHLAPQ